MESDFSWSSESLLNSVHAFYDSLITGINKAEKTIDFEVYIYKNDDLGLSVAKALINASKRGVAVRVIVDGVGSGGWINNLGLELIKAGIEVKVYNQLPWERMFSAAKTFENQSLFRLFKFINRRNHRKDFIIDGKAVWVGSMNVWDVAGPTSGFTNPWREMGICVEGEAVKFFKAAFELNWNSKRIKHRRLRNEVKRILRKSILAPVRLNSTFYLRRQLNKHLIRRLVRAEKRIWIANAYFVPGRAFIKAIHIAISRGVDVRLVLPATSDIFFMPWVSAVFLSDFIKRGVKVYSYQPGMLHAKYMLIDSVGIVGSSNLNQRSFLHDLEADVITKNDFTLSQLENEYEKDLSESILLSSMELERMARWKKVLGKVILLFKTFI